MRLEEQTQWMCHKMGEMMGFSETNVDEGVAAWRREDDGDGWQRWNGNWWIRVAQQDFNSKRSEISRGFRRMIIREQNGMASLLRELRNGIKPEIEGTNRPRSSTVSESDEPSRNDEVITNSTHERIQLVLR